MSGMIHQRKSKTSAVEATLDIHYSDSLPCSCHIRAMKALTWQRTHLNEAVHIFHRSVWKCCRFELTAQTPVTAAPGLRGTSHGEDDLRVLDPLPLTQQSHVLRLDLRISLS